MRDSQTEFTPFLYGRLPPRQSLGSLLSHPFALSLKRALPLGKANSFHAFDTGAFVDGRMTTSIHPSFTLQEFELPPVTSSAQDLVKTFYGSNRNYLDCAPSNEIDIDEIIKRRLLRVETYYNLIRFAPNDNADERVHSIEVQVGSDVPLKGNLLAVADSRSFLRYRSK